MLLGIKLGLTVCKTSPTHHDISLTHMINFELIIVKGVMYVPRFILLLLLNYLLKKLLLGGAGDRSAVEHLPCKHEACRAIILVPVTPPPSRDHCSRPAILYPGSKSKMCDSRHTTALLFSMKALQ